MLAKMTSKNQITLPKAVVSQLPAAEYFDIQVEGGKLVLTPVRVQKADAVREKLAQLGIDESDIADAVAWARRPE
ncbi:AbrB/MazE/SpoVT family DNA-binding domain-containing protein [Methylocaldum sp.]|uniref:AbrB/MazE/SpoVT family DNA-binding domain-containing protein n=1 Tax=Methylocaldum sp. TaxID=1969727 RepID=UPI002D5A78B3|nr:AbrB/MazE/SpoVT family DNA-binding domain-containing protein [Methylocaldum sp.]HYE37225.1 AbrB/MazE/SpoVT family DNA-binding domain-containing protein [Methylocaldum sp.]